MNLARGTLKHPFLVATLSAIAATSMAQSVGKYSYHSTDKSRTGSISIHSVSGQQVVLDLQVEFNPSMTKDGFYTRSGELDSKTVLPLVGNVAMYQSPAEDPSRCALVFVFARKGNINVSQFGECSWFGEGVSATGHYTK
jgi:hypothetical protein